MNDEERERERAEIKTLGDVTDPKNNPLIPTGEDEPVDPVLTLKGNPMIPADGQAAYALQQSARRRPVPAENVPDRPSVESVEKILAKFIEGASAADLERLKAALGIRR